MKKHLIVSVSGIISLLICLALFTCDLFDLPEAHHGLSFYTALFLLTFALSAALIHFLAKILRRDISQSLLNLADTARLISEKQDYSLRVSKSGNNELDRLADAFNDMLAHIHERNKALSELNQTLEQKVQARTIESERINKELESFSYSVSHDLRAPVRAINGYITMYIEDYGNGLDGEAQRLVENVLKNSQKMGVMIDDLLVFSKLGRREIVKAELSMKDLASGVWKELVRMEPERNIDFVLAELPAAYAERKIMEQVWINLLSNAIKYTQHKERAVVEITWFKKDGHTVYCVKDNGAGFDMAYYDKLFGVFQRLHSEEEFAGTGAGLAIVQRIIERHGGQVWAESQVNNGTTFYFFLP